MIPLAVFEEIIDISGVAVRIEAMLPIGARARQLLARTLLLGMLLVLADHRPAHLTRVHQALTGLPEDDQVRLGVLGDWEAGPRQLTYRQTEYTFGLVAGALGKDEPDGLPSGQLQRICDDLLESSVPAEFTDASTSLAVDWTDLESFSRPPARGTSDCADPEASWGHRKNNLMGIWQQPLKNNRGFNPWQQTAGTCLPDPCLPPAWRGMPSLRRAGSGRVRRCREPVLSPRGVTPAGRPGSRHRSAPV